MGSENNMVAVPGSYVIRRNGAFFRPNAQGYTNHVIAAGFYTREEADRYADVEGVTIEPLSRYRDDAERTKAECDRLLARLASPQPDAQQGEVAGIPKGMKPWHGGDSAPDDWDGGFVLQRNGTALSDASEGYDWRNFGGTTVDGDSDIIAYTPATLPSPALDAATIERLTRLLTEARWYVNDSLEAHEHSDGRDLLNRIDRALPNAEKRHG